MTQKQLIAISTGHFYTGTYACNQVKLQMWHFSDFAWIFLTGVAQLQNESNQMTEYLLMIADIYISISMETFDIENIKYEKTLATVRFRYIL